MAVTLFFLACISRSHRNLPAAQEKGLFESGLKAFSKNDYTKAEESFAKLLSDFPTTRWLAGAYYNWGLALESQKKYEAAIEKYRRVVDHYEGLHTRDSGDALYRMSVCYEFLNDDNKAVIVLLQLFNQKDKLRSEVAQIEVPARLAAGYARLGQLDEATKFYELAEKGLRRMRGIHLAGDYPSWLPKTLYSMGKLAPVQAKKGKDFAHYTIAMEQAQVWLLRVAELNSKDWSEKAAKEIIDTYNEAWKRIESVPLEEGEDDLLARAKQQKTRKSMAMSLDKVIEKLQLERIPNPNKDETTHTERIFKVVSKIQKSLNHIIGRRYVRDEQTAEAKRRHSSKGQGRIVD